MARELGQVAHGSYESMAPGPGSWEYDVGPESLEFSRIYGSGARTSWHLGRGAGNINVDRESRSWPFVSFG